MDRFLLFWGGGMWDEVYAVCWMNKWRGDVHKHYKTHTCVCGWGWAWIVTLFHENTPQVTKNK